MSEARQKPARIVVADDQELIRVALQGVLKHDPDLEVVGEAASGREAVELCLRLRPDLVLMDVRMPDMDGLAATRQIKRHISGTSVLIISAYENQDYLLEAVKAGAAGYVLKDASAHRIINAVRRTLSGESPMEQELAMELIQRLAKDAEVRESVPPRPGVSGSAATPIGPLTPREIDVVGLIAQGKSNAEIARKLGIAGSTAKTHVQRVISKLGGSDRTQAVVRAIELGLIPPTTQQ